MRTMERVSIAPNPTTEETTTKGLWLQVLSHVDPRFGGMSAAVPKLAEELRRREGYDARIASFSSPEEIRELHSDVPFTLWPPNRSKWLTDSDLRSRFQTTVKGSIGVHIHGLWEASTLAACLVARRTRTPYVISPHGMLEPWALANKRRKKLVYTALFERRNLDGAACVHALTRAEALDCRRFGFKGSIAIIPNGIDIPASCDASLFRARFPRIKGKRVLLFLGRVHYKKGVDLLLHAWAKISDQHPDVVLVIAGPDSEGTVAKVARLSVELKISSRVLFTDMLKGSAKWSALAASDYFVLPSHSEGLSVATLEALGCGLPVIISEQCNLPQVTEAGAGWQVKTDVDDIARTLTAALNISHETYAVMSARAEALAQQNFSWKRVTDCMGQLYQWINGGPRPDRVEFLEDVV
ncbi:glycosyltransferase [Terriglobus sp. TAA 43]|uniref:glycosyltransferase n=1 Tax=Terriglobus sp. TAA 43 TaxID=278961 RepID=UPI00068B4428|nr:glycosyltransferase [Terriglobus sp. TAA 43]